MKNSKYFPFERNKYFYGKLLSVDDFELEQRYINNKRRMTNRFLYGMGVVVGLYVVRVDEKTISVESGFALDAFGREIVIDTPVIKKLSLLEGFKNCVEDSQKDYVYLCLNYNEEEAGAVHNVTGNSMMQGEETFNKIKETYQLYLTEREPEQTILDKSELYETCQILYAQDGMIIKQFVSKYAIAGSGTQIRIEIENLTKKYLAFSYELMLERFTYGGQPSIIINFDEMQYEKTGRYTIVYTLEVTDSVGIQGAIVRNKDSVHMFINKEECHINLEQETIFVNIIEEDIRQQIMKDYYRTDMENIVKNSEQNQLYLAKLYLLHVGGSYVIDKVDNVPFNQYILKQNLSSAIHQLSIDGHGKKNKNMSHEGGYSKFNGKNEAEKGIHMAQGKYWLDLEGGGQKGSRYVSEEITHGLGLGSAMIQVGIEDEDGGITYGSSEIFEDTDPMIELAVKVFPEKGTFQIGGRLLEQVIKSGVNIRWNAILNTEEKIVELATRKIFIKPSVLELATRESHYLEAICSNISDNTIQWKVKEHGGSITENGMYTAPNTPGVYEVVAQSMAFPEIKASIFVIVRDV